MGDPLNPLRRTGRTRALAAALALGMIALAAAPARADVDLAETGSTLLNPLFQDMGRRIHEDPPRRAHNHRRYRVGRGHQASNFGGRAYRGVRCYMSDAQARRYPQIMHVPMAISAVTVNYNLPDLNMAALKLSGPVLAGIYTGKIREWDDKAIASLNPDVPLPHQDIIPVYREDGSGDTFIFTQYLTFTTPWWENDVGFGTEITWPPVPGSASAKENSGVLQKIKETPYSLTYIGVSFHTEIANAQLGTALVKSYSGEFLLPTPESVQAAAASLTPRTPLDERITLVNAPGAGCYPLINYEYAIVFSQAA